MQQSSEQESLSSLSSSWRLTRSKEGLDPEALCRGIPQMAKDVGFAQAVIHSWNQDIDQMVASNAQSKSAESETRLLEYTDDEGTTLYGHLIRRRQGGVYNHTDDDDHHDGTKKKKKKIPGVLLFHTGAGPHDISLLWKADLLVCNKDIFPDGCVVLVTDILSDDSGWGWSADRTKYIEACRKVLATTTPPLGDGDADAESGGGDERPLLQSRIRAALKAFQNVAPDEVDMNQLSALGWCLGGHSILELGRMKVPGMKAMITFHGVFDGRRGVSPRSPAKTSPQANKKKESSTPTSSTSTSRNNESTSDILICHGQLDPFVPRDTVLIPAIDTLKYLGHSVRLLELDGAFHGFSNPAQDLNPNKKAFAYNANAATVSWSETTAMLKKTFAASTEET